MNSKDDPKNLSEAQRLAILRSYEILDTPREEAFDAITRIAARVVDVPIALVFLIDEERLWFKSSYGFQLQETARGSGLVDHVITTHTATFVLDATQDARFARDPLVIGEPHARFFVGVPLLSREGAVLGTLCALGPKPKKIEPHQVELIEQLGRQVQVEFEARRLARLHLLESTRATDATKLFQYVVDQVPVMLFMKDAESLRVTLWNREAESVTGVAREDVLGRTGFHLFPREDQVDKFQELDRRVIREGKMTDAEEIVVGVGGPRTLHTKKVPVYSSDGTATHLLGISQDITELRARQHEVAEINRTLEERVAEGTEQLRQAEAQLHVSQKLEALGRLAGGVAHDFNNLLTVILGYSQAMVSSGTLPAEDLEDLQEVVQAGERAASLTKQLSAFGRRQVLTPEIVDLAEVVSSMESLLQKLGGDGTDLSLHGAHGDCWVEADRSQLEQVIVNLVVNARDAMPNGGHIVLEASRIPDAASATEGGVIGPGVLLEVRDTGAGIDAATLAHIFEPFFTTKPEGQGTGLGLATVLGIVRQSKGHIDVRTSPGEGTSFRIVLPQASRSAVPARPASSDGWRVPHGDETILVVDDDEQIVRYVARVLRRDGYHVLEARSPGDALLICEGDVERLDLVVCDVSMPRVNGVELIRRLRERRPELRVLFMSGFQSENTPIPEGEMLLPKPASAEDILSAVATCLSVPADA